MTRRGFTLVELLVAMVVASLLGIGLTQMLVSDSRFVGRQEGMLSARATARAAMNVMGVELRMVGDSGLVAATATEFTVRVPYAFAMACQSSGSILYASLMPTDSLAYASAAPDGILWRNAIGEYVLEDRRLSAAFTTDSSFCQADSIRVVPGGSVITVGNIPGASAPPSGSIFNLYQLVTYRFDASADLPGRTALWREAGGVSEEIATPFDATSGFGYLVGVNLVPQASPPADLSTVRGLELQLIGASDTHASGADFETYDLTTHVPFFNRSGDR
jgi:prepilin-type N-terminal cleavage/methylation domain-containing protein